MFTPQDFVTCVQDNLKAKGFHHKRIDEITKDYEDLVNMYRAQGRDVVTASTLGMSDLWERMSREAIEKAKRTSKMISVQAENIALVKSGVNADTSLFLLDGKKGSKGVAVARAAVAKIENDPRFATTSYTGYRHALQGQFYALFGGSLEAIGKGAFGVQKGAAHLPNIIREVFGQGTGDKAAREFAQAWLKFSDLAPDLFNQAGGSMRKLSRFIPQSFNSVKIAKTPRNDWVNFHLNAIDWDRTVWPNGLPIEPSQRQGVLENVYNTLSTDGAAKIDAKAFRGRGKAVGNMLENHRFLHYKDADSWLDAHNRFGDGTVFDVFTRHVDDMAHRIALVDTFGPNPDMTAMNMQSIVRSEAAKLGPKELADAEAVMKNKFVPMFETVMRQNPMDPNSLLGAGVVGTSNILASAQLASASLAAIPGDLVTSGAVRALNNMGLWDGLGYLMKAMTASRKDLTELSVQSGLILDDFVQSNYAATRWGMAASFGPAWTRRITDGVLRASLLSGWTTRARLASQMEFMGLFQRSRSMAFDELPFKQILQRHGVTPDEWDALRTNVQPWTKKGASFLRPIDVLETSLPDKQVLYKKFQSLIHDESRMMIMDSTLEASVYMKSTTRPDTLPGAVLYSFAMYKNFPVSFMMVMGRLGMASPNATTRVKFFAGLISAMTLAGALGIQMRELSKGKEPMPMDNPAFFGKAALAGGGLSIFGDFLFSGINQFGQGPQDAVAGPLVNFLGDTTNLALGDVFQFANAMGGLSDGEFKSTTGERAVEYARRYTPGSSLWWSRLVMEREIFDRLQEVADPNAYQKRQRKVRKQKKTYGNDYFLPPGQRTGLFGD